MKTPYLYIGIIAMLMISCSKELEENCPPRKRVIEGFLYERCNFNPMSNVKLILAENPGRTYYGKLKGHGRLDSIYTDSNGHFKFQYVSNSGSLMHIKHYSNSTVPHVLVERIPNDYENEAMELFYIPSLSLDIWLNVKNEYTSQDTLIIHDSNPYRSFKIPGPFKSGQALYIDASYILNPTMDSSYVKAGWYLQRDKNIFGISEVLIDGYCKDYKMTFEIE